MLCGGELISNAWCSSKEDTLRTVRAFEGNFLLDLLELERDERRVGVAIAGMEAREDFGRLFFLTARVEPAGPECALNCQERFLSGRDDTHDSGQKKTNKKLRAAGTTCTNSGSLHDHSELKFPVETIIPVAVIWPT
jgi:hypothetical protein